MRAWHRKLFVMVGLSVLSLVVVGQGIAVAQQYPPVSPTVSPADASRVDDPGDPGAQAKSLAFTGSSESIPTVWIAAGLVVFGTALVLVARQRRSASNRI